MERNRGSRVTFNARPCTFAIINTTKMNIASFKGYLKGKSSMMIFKDLANLRYKYGNSNFWATGYYVSTVGLNEATIRKYIRDQEKEDVLEDKLTKKESHNPFKGLLQ